MIQASIKKYFIEVECKRYKLNSSKCRESKFSIQFSDTDASLAPKRPT